MTMTREIKTGKYYAVHCKTPRGWGYWWFGDLLENWTFSYTGSYAEAKRAAIKAANDANMTNAVYVLP